MGGHDWLGLIQEVKTFTLSQTQALMKSDTERAPPLPHSSCWGEIPKLPGPWSWYRVDPLGISNLAMRHANFIYIQWVFFYDTWVLCFPLLYNWQNVGKQLFQLLVALWTKPHPMMVPEPTALGSRQSMASSCPAPRRAASDAPSPCLVRISSAAFQRFSIVHPCVMMTLHWLDTRFFDFKVASWNNKKLHSHVTHVRFLFWVEAISKPGRPLALCWGQPMARAGASLWSRRYGVYGCYGGKSPLPQFPTKKTASTSCYEGDLRRTR